MSTRHECPRCGETKDRAQFYDRTKDRKCKACIAYLRKAKYDSCETTRNGIKYRNRVKLVRQYGLSMGQFGEMLDAQGGGCAVCRVPLDTFAPASASTAACIDHDHSTGKVRGVLCRCCNLALGYAKDNPDHLRRMAAYLEKSNETSN